MSRVSIVGAGITGLSLAYFLEKKGIRTELIESSEKIGGVINTKLVDKCLLEAGPNTTVLKPALRELINDLQISTELIFTEESANKRFIAKKKEELIAVPSHPIKALSTNLISKKAKLKILTEPLRKKQQIKDESVHSFISRNFGTEVAENLVDPALNGIWAADIEKLSARSSLPKLWGFQTKGSSIIKGLIKNKTKIQSVSFKKGLSFLAEEIVNHLPNDTIKLSTRLQNIDSKNKIIFCTPAKETARYIKNLDPNLAQMIEKVPHSSLGQLHLLYKKKDVEHALDGFGFLVPTNLRLGLLGAIFSSSIFQNRADSKHHLITCFTGGAKNLGATDLENDAVIQQVISELNCFIRSKSRPEILNTNVYKNAIPNYAVGHHKLVDKVREFERKNPNISFSANWISGIGLSDRIEEARSLSEKLVG